MEWKEIASTRNDPRSLDYEGWIEYVIIETTKPLSYEELGELIESDFNSHLGCEGCPGQWFRYSYKHQSRMLGDNKYLILVHHALDV